MWHFNIAAEGESEEWYPLERTETDQINSGKQRYVRLSIQVFVDLQTLEIYFQGNKRNSKKLRFMLREDREPINVQEFTRIFSSN